MPLYPAVLIGPLLLTPSASPHLPKGQTPPGGSYSPSWLRGAHDVDVASISVPIWMLGEGGHTNLPRCGQMHIPFRHKYHDINYNIRTSNNRHHTVIQRPLYVNANAHYRKSCTDSLLVKPVASSNMISCQSGLILCSNLMAPDKHFTSRLRDQRECATVSMTTQQIHI